LIQTKIKLANLRVYCGFGGHALAGQASALLDGVIPVR
jgi:hypothetical protein